jgi:hypothetical protein
MKLGTLVIGCGEEDLRHRFDAGDVELLKLADVGKNLVELAAIEFDFSGVSSRCASSATRNTSSRLIFNFALPFYSNGILAVRSSTNCAKISALKLSTRLPI